MKKIFIEHIISIVIALVLVIILGGLTINKFNTETNEISISGHQEKLNSRYANFLTGDKAELNFMASLKNKKQLTLFGSSEFSEIPLASYNFFPDSLGKQMMGVGHAFHQHFSILLELLAADKVNTNSEIVIFLSPEWFRDGLGTNTEAFIEFGRPNFLLSIKNNSNIPMEYKEYIGKYIYDNSNSFDGSSFIFDYFKELYINDVNSILYKFKNYVRSKLEDTKTIVYNPKLRYINSKKWNQNYDLIALKLQNEFIHNITNNSIYVNDTYYEKYLLNEDGTMKYGEIEPININSNVEYQDFKMLVKYIKEKKIKASFIVIPLNPYYYKGLENLNPLMDSLKSTLTSNSIPLLNLYVTDTTNYEPGTLNDVMHLGDYGWMRVNKFINTTYYE